MIWFKTQNLKRSLVISRFDGTRFDVIAPIQMESFFGVPQKLKCNEQYEKTNEKFSEVPFGDGDNWVFPSVDRVHR